MRKLLSILVVLAIPGFALAQNRQIKAALAEASVSCVGDAVPRLGPDGKLSLVCLPTSIAMLPFMIPNPEVLATSKPQLALPNFAAGTVTSLSCSCEGTGCTVNFNFDARAKSAPSTPGTDLHTSEFVADEDGVSVDCSSGCAGDRTNAANQVWNLSVSGVTNAPTLLRCYLNVERNN